VDHDIAIGAVVAISFFRVTINPVRGGRSRRIPSCAEALPGAVGGCTSGQFIGHCRHSRRGLPQGV